MSRTAQQYKHETDCLKRYFAGGDSPVLKYISVVEEYVGQLQKVSLEAILDEIEYNRLFQSTLCLVGETYRPDQFLSVWGEKYIRIFSVEFMAYMAERRGKLIRKLTWEEVCDLDYKYDVWRIRWLCENHFYGDSLDYAIKNISLKTLWGIA